MIFFPLKLTLFNGFSKIDAHLYNLNLLKLSKVWHISSQLFELWPHCRTASYRSGRDTSLPLPNFPSAMCTARPSALHFNWQRLVRSLSLSLSYELQKFWLMRRIIGAMFTDHHRKMGLTLVVRSKWSSSVLSALRYDIIGGWQESRTTIQPLYVFILLPIQSHPCNIYICCCLVLNGLTYWAEIQCALYAMGYLRWMTVYAGISYTMEQTPNTTNTRTCIIFLDFTHA